MNVYKCEGSTDTVPLTYSWGDIQKAEGVYQPVDSRLNDNILIVIRVFDGKDSIANVLFFGKGQLQPARAGAWCAHTFYLKRNAKIFLEVK